MFCLWNKLPTQATGKFFNTNNLKYHDLNYIISLIAFYSVSNYKSNKELILEVGLPRWIQSKRKKEGKKNTYFNLRYGFYACRDACVTILTNIKRYSSSDH